jgi:hypothetical protein
VQTADAVGKSQVAYSGRESRRLRWNAKVQASDKE